MKKIKIFLILLAVAILCVFCIHSINYKNKFDNGNSIANWFDWKVKHLDTQEQKEVIAYFETINSIFNEANSTVWLPESSPSKYLDPQKAYEIVEDSMQKVKKIIPPSICIKHYDLTVKILNYIIDYHSERLRLGGDIGFETKLNSEPEFRDAIRDNKIKRLDLEEKRNKEYFKILHKVGFYKNMTDEAFKLKLITKEEKKRLEQLRKKDRR